MHKEYRVPKHEEPSPQHGEIDGAMIHNKDAKKLEERRKKMAKKMLGK